MSSTQHSPPARTALLTALALAGFAANSLLCRAALGPGRVDAASFTTLRLVSGALVLAALARVGPGAAGGSAARTGPHGSWASAGALFVYAAAFSLAYVRIRAGVGALLLFGCVQATMLGWGLVRGERPHVLEWAGLGVALAGLALLTLPGASAPDGLGAALMALAGVAWGVYSLRGRGARSPLQATAGNFLRSVPLALGLSALALLLAVPPHASAAGVALALASGALASGVGYSLWYAALPHLSAARAAVVQLLVPVVAAAAAVVLLDEPASLRLVGAGALVLGGVVLALVARARRARQP